MGHQLGQGQRYQRSIRDRALNWQQANPEYISVNWEASGGGAFAVIPLKERGRLPEQLPLFRGHTAAVLDTDWPVYLLPSRKRI